jgi:predicted N-formylglutamate amidohydrolase
VTCEHAGYSVPDRFRNLFLGQEKILQSHRGWDPGALILAKAVSDGLNAPFYFYPITRLLIEPNRSEKNPSLLSEFSRSLPEDDLRHLLECYYRPYRDGVYRHINKFTLQKKSVLHISVHTFTPNFKGKERKFDIGLLYDPSRATEKEFSRQFKTSLKRIDPECKVRMNKPYLGKSDGLTTWLRKEFDDDLYTGIELEVNQAIYNDGASSWQSAGQKITQAFRAIPSVSTV